MKNSMLVLMLRYAVMTFRHKWLVYDFGRQVGAPWFRLVIHDWSKLSPAELPAYARKFGGDPHCEEAFAHAWNHHSKVNKHHWEYWVPVTAHQQSRIPLAPLPMPEWAIREMLADWLAVEYKATGELPRSLADWHWYQKCYDVIKLAPQTRYRLHELADAYFASDHAAAIRTQTVQAKAATNVIAAE